ncbi:MAG: S-layer homology domain-containing protein [Oscillospiraceae bacterium]
MKKLLAGLLALVLALSLAAPAFAATEDVPLAEQALVLRELGIMTGDQNGDLRLDSVLSRAELTKLMVAASPLKDSVSRFAVTDPYPDVPHTSWAAPWVQAAVSAGYVKGNLQGYFEPNRAVTLAESATMALRLLGYSDSDFPLGWPGGQMALYRSLELDVGVAATEASAAVTRGDALHLLYNLLTVNTKSGAPYLTVLGHTLNKDGEVDVEALLKLEREGPITVTGDWKAGLPGDPEKAVVYRDNKRAALKDLKEWDTLYWAKDGSVLWALPDSGDVMREANAAVEGPVVALGDWQKALPYPLAQSAVTRNGRAAAVSDIAENDVVYWNKHANRLYVYSEKVTGMVEAVSPALSAPTAIKVAGTTYPLETSAAIFSCSDLGSVHKGDMVTLLLGRTNGVAAVVPPVETPRPLVGVITAAGSAGFTDEQNKPYTAKTVTLTATDGTSHVYRWDDDNVKPGDLASITPNDSGVTVTKLSGTTLTGKVSADGTTLGGRALAPDVEILDTYGDSAALRVYPLRLAGVKLTEGMVRYYEENAAGELSRIILKDVTGDLHQYGVLTAVSELSMGMTLRGDYGYLLGGTPGRTASDGRLYSVLKGPFRLWADGKLSNLTELKGVTVDQKTVKSGAKLYPMADQTAVYLLQDGDYALSTLGRVTGDGYTLNAYYDKLPQEGGLVRVLVAKAV